MFDGKHLARDNDAAACHTSSSGVTTEWKEVTDNMRVHTTNTGLVTQYGYIIL